MRSEPDISLQCMSRSGVGPLHSIHQPNGASLPRLGKTHLDLIWGKICLPRGEAGGAAAVVSSGRSDCSRARRAALDLI